MVYSSVSKLLIENQLLPELLEQIRSAKKRIYGTVYYIRVYNRVKNNPVAQIVNELWEAKKRGVEIKILLNRQGGGKFVITPNIQTAKLFEKIGIETKLSELGRLTHSKMWIFDDDKVIIGSHNMSTKGLRVSREVSILTTDQQINKELTDYFLTNYRNTPPWQK